MLTLCYNVFEITFWIIAEIGHFTADFGTRGPALTLKYEHPDAKIQAPISIDINPAINTCFAFKQLGIEWPRKGWPPKDLQRAVKEKRILLVARQNFFWSASYSECERELSKRADEDGGIRKMVHKLMKVFHDRFWRKHDNHQLSSYMVKVMSLRIQCVR